MQNPGGAHASTYVTLTYNLLPPNPNQVPDMVQNHRAEPVYQLLNRSIACRARAAVGGYGGLSLVDGALRFIRAAVTRLG